MGPESWLILLGILIVFVVLAIFVVRAEEATYYYQCYNQSEYKRRAFHGVCKGIPNAEKCKVCPYYRRYIKEIKRENT